MDMQYVFNIMNSWASIVEEQAADLPEEIDYDEVVAVIKKAEELVERLAVFCALLNDKLPDESGQLPSDESSEYDDDNPVPPEALNTDGGE